MEEPATIASLHLQGTLGHCHWPSSQGARHGKYSFCRLPVGPPSGPVVLGDVRRRLPSLSRLCATEVFLVLTGTVQSADNNVLSPCLQDISAAINTLSLPPAGKPFESCFQHED